MAILQYFSHFVVDYMKKNTLIKVLLTKCHFMVLHHGMFDNDAIFFTAKKGKDKLTLKSNLNRSYIKVSYIYMTCVGFWHTNKTDAPFVCIEPGHGFLGHDLVIEDIEKMIDMNKLKLGKYIAITTRLVFMTKVAKT